MLSRKNILIHLLSLFVLSLGFVFCRYVFFEIHGMKQLPVLLFAVGLVLVGISFFLKGRAVPVFSSLGYSAGFIAAALLETGSVDAGGGATSSFWIIWTLVFGCLSLIGILVESKDSPPAFLFYPKGME